MISEPYFIARYERRGMGYGYDANAPVTRPMQIADDLWYKQILASVWTTPKEEQERALPYRMQSLAAMGFVFLRGPGSPETEEGP